MRIPYISSLRSDVWAKDSASRLGGLQQLENFLASEEARIPAQVRMAENLDPSTRGAFDSESGTIDLNASLLQQGEPYQAAETLFHESRHAYQHHIVQNPQLAKDPSQLKDWQMSENGGYVQPSDPFFADYRWQPEETDAREMARARTDDLYQSTFQDTSGYPSYQAQKQQQLVDDIEYAKAQYGLDTNLSNDEALGAIQAQARQAMVSQYEAQGIGQARENELQQASTMASADTVKQPDEKEIAQFTGEVAGSAVGGPTGAEAGKFAEEATAKARSATAESVGQSTEAPLEGTQKVAGEAPAADASQSDEQQYYGYSR